MRGRLVLWVSLGLNLALLAWVCLPARRTLPPVVAPGPVAAPPMAPAARTNVVVRRLNFVWNEIESEDYPTYIANLRLINCPEPTIRDIIVADVNQLFAQRRLTEVVTPEQQWWRSTPDPTVVAASAQKQRELEAERRDLLTRLLGPDWERSSYLAAVSGSGNAFDGPVLGALSPETRYAVHQLEAGAMARRQAYVESMQRQGKPMEASELAQLRAETREQLARVLNPEQLEEYLLRYSSNARDLRNQFRDVELAPEEFRAIFRMTDPVDQQIQTEFDSATADLRRRVELEQQRDISVQQVLSPERYEQYKLNQDPIYRRAQAALDQTGAPPDQLLPLAAIYRLTDLEEQRIRNDSALTPEERIERLQETRTAQQDSLRQLLGTEAFERYQRGEIR